MDERQRKADSDGQIPHEKQFRVDSDFGQRKLSWTGIAEIIGAFGVAGADSVGFCRSHRWPK
jgi:hypothetical protein